MKLSFRDYAQGDEETYVNIHNERYKTCTWFSKHGPITVSNAKQEIEEKKKNPTYRLIFALTQDQPIGFIEASMEDANTACARARPGRGTPPTSGHRWAGGRRP